MRPCCRQGARQSVLQGRLGSRPRLPLAAPGADCGAAPQPLHAAGSDCKDRAAHLCREGACRRVAREQCRVGSRKMLATERWVAWRECPQTIGLLADA